MLSCKAPVAGAVMPFVSVASCLITALCCNTIISASGQFFILTLLKHLQWCGVSSHQRRLDQGDLCSWVWICFLPEGIRSYIDLREPCMNSINILEHELKNVLSWVHLSVPWKGGIHSCWTAGGTQLCGDSFGVSHVLRNISIDLDH